jgi:hypothetical protein
VIVLTGAPFTLYQCNDEEKKLQSLISDSRPVYVGLMLDKLAVEQGLSEYVGFPLSVSLILATDSAIKQHT